MIEFLRHIHRLIKSVTRGNASERAGSLEMLVFLMDNLKYSMQVRPQPYPLQHFHHPHGLHMAQVWRDAEVLFYSCFMQTCL